MYVRDGYVRAAVLRGLTDASSWLARPRCRSLLSEFNDTRGRPLTARLAEMGEDLDGYLELLLFFDGTDSPICARGNVLAFTAPGNRAIYVCGRDFERACHRDREQAPSVIIHELLHTLGLPESPPSPAAITFRVQKACWP